MSGLVLDQTSRTVTVGSATLSLTRSEFDLLKILVSHPGRVYTRPQILDAIQGEEKDVTDRTVDTLMVGLLAALGIGALIVLALFFFTRRYELRLARLAAERDLQDRLLDEMRKLERFRRDFVSNVTHEIKTPVTGILGAVEILAGGSSALDAEDRKELQHVLNDQSVRLNALVEPPARRQAVRGRAWIMRNYAIIRRRRQIHIKPRHP